MSDSSIQDAYHGDPTLLVLAAAALHRPALRTKLAGAEFVGADQLPDSAFAWPEKRRFPIHSEADTLASFVYRAKLASVPTHVDAALSSAARAYGLGPEVFRSEAPATKVASAPEIEYAVPSQRRLPLGTPSMVKVAEEVLLRDGLAALPYDELVKGAKKVASAAVSMDLLPSPDLRRFAGHGACHIPTLRDHLNGRATLVKTAEARMAYDALSKAVGAHEDRGVQVVFDAPVLEKIASALHKLDVQYEVDAEYGPRILDPMRAVFNTTTKVASSGETISLGGTAVPVEALCRLKADDWRDLGLDDLASLAEGKDVRNLEAQLRVLPKSLQSTVASAALGA